MIRHAPTRFSGFHVGPSTLTQRLFGHARTRASAWLWVSVAALLLGGAGLKAHTRRLDHERLALAATRTPPAPAPAPDAALPAAQEARWRLAADHLNADWPGWFEALERRTPPEVALRAIEPDATHRQLRLQGEAASLDTLMDWARALAGESAFVSVRPMRHDTSEDAGTPVVRLTLEIDLSGAHATNDHPPPAGRVAP